MTFDDKHPKRTSVSTRALARTPKTRTWTQGYRAVIGILGGIGILTLQGCDDGNDLTDNLGEACDLKCSSEGILEGNASISGVANIDAFFSAVLSVRDAAASSHATVRAELLALARALQLQVDVSADVSVLAGQVRDGITAKLAAYVEGGIKVTYKPAECRADVELTAKASAECDVQATPGMVEAQCEGTCEVSAEVAAECSAEGRLRCEGQAPNFQCMGTCSGTCQLEVAAACEGSCNGSCEGECSVCTGGQCQSQGGVVTNCAGSCMGQCQGSCELSAGGTCSGKCEGSCEYDPGTAMCEANATAKCDVSGEFDAKCEGKCEGKVTPPMVSAECKASVEAKAKAEIECTPPQLHIGFQFKAGLDANAQAEFKAWLEIFRIRYAALVAASAKLEFVGQAAVELGAAGKAAVQTAITQLQGGIKSGADLRVKFGLGCALGQLNNVGTVLGQAQGQVTGSVSAVATVSSAITVNRL